MLREMRVEDAAAVHEIFTEALGYATSESVIANRIQELARDDRTLSLVWTDDDQTPPAGFIHAMRYETLHATGGWDVISLAVAPGRQGEGIGGALLAEAERELLERGATYVRLNSRMERTGAHGFYEHAGYDCDKVQKRFIKRLG